MFKVFQQDSWGLHEDWPECPMKLKLGDPIFFLSDHFDGLLTSSLETIGIMMLLRPLNVLVESYVLRHSASSKNFRVKPNITLLH